MKPSSRGARHEQLGHRRRRRALRRRRMCRRAVLRPADRPVRPQEAVHDHPGRLHGRDGADRVLEEPTWYFVCRFDHRRRHRRRVRGDQLRHRRADPEEVPRPHRHRDQRLVLGRRRRRRAPDDSAARPDRHRPRGRLAARVRSRRHPWRSVFCWSDAMFRRAPDGCSSTAARTRPKRSSRRIEKTVVDETGEPLPERVGDAHHPAAQDDRLADDRQDRLHPLSQAHRLCLALFIGQAFLYNAFFFTYGDGLVDFLGVTQTGYYIAAFAVSNFAGALLLGTAVRHGRTGPDDRGDVHRVRRPARNRRSDARGPERDDADDLRRW